MCLSSTSWGQMKALSNAGYDVVRNRAVDYGNVQYRAVLLMWCMLEPRILAAMEDAAQAFAALDVRAGDTAGVL